MLTAPINGPCTPWVDGLQVSQMPAVVAAAGKASLQDQDVLELCAEAAVVASEVLFELSGRVFRGECGPGTIRPESRPTDMDTRSWGARLSPLGWFSTFGAASSFGAATPGVVARYGSLEPPTIELPWPVREVLLVKIDGVVIPGPYDPVTGLGEWELREHKELVRIRPTPSYTPTQRYGWPTSQVHDLPDSEPGTFSVTITWGDDPPASGKLAARKLAEFLVLPQIGDDSRYPSRVTSISRQGVSTKVASVIDLLQKGSVGLYEVDLFLRAVNPHGNQRQAAVWSPDIARPRRQASTTLPS